jgi:hypothetical protein
MANDLNKLNEVLFTTLQGVQDGTIDEKKAQTIVNIGNSIVNNAKIQLSAFKLTKGKTNLSLMAPNNDKKLIYRDGDSRSDFALEFAKHKGYKNVAEAIAVMGKGPFNKGLDKYIEDADMA